jgi:hypothetical protein
LNWSSAFSQLIWRLNILFESSFLSYTKLICVLIYFLNKICFLLFIIFYFIFNVDIIYFLRKKLINSSISLVSTRDNWSYIFLFVISCNLIIMIITRLFENCSMSTCYTILIVLNVIWKLIVFIFYLYFTFFLSYLKIHKLIC